jgi:hypothetical protein
MLQYVASVPKIPIPFNRMLEIVALVDDVPGERWDERAKPMLDYFMTFEESFNRFPGFGYEVQGVYQEIVDGRIKFYTYVVRE